jgi:hypothetical protein
MNDIGSKVKLAVLGTIAFGFLGFYILFAVQGTMLLTKCSNESRDVVSLVTAAPGALKSTPEPTPVEDCKAMGKRLQNVLDLFTPISGVVTAVALAALGYKPDATAKVVRMFRGYKVGETRMNFLDLMIVIYLLAWTLVGMLVCYKTAALSLEDASRWNVEWLRNFGRTWWPSALTAVAFWLGVPTPKQQSITDPLDGKKAT